MVGWFIFDTAMSLIMGMGLGATLVMWDRRRK
jgi:hypothetical protein